MVLDHHHDHERPENQRKNAEDVRLRERDGMRAVKAFAHGIQRAGADVAVDDAEREQREGEKAPACWFFACVMFRTQTIPPAPGGATAECMARLIGGRIKS